MRRQRDLDDHAPGGWRGDTETSAYAGTVELTCSPPSDRILRWCCLFQRHCRNPVGQFGLRRFSVERRAMASRRCGDTLLCRPDVLSGRTVTNRWLGRTPPLARRRFGPVVFSFRIPAWVRLCYHRACRLLHRCIVRTRSKRPSSCRPRFGRIRDGQVPSTAVCLAMRTDPDCWLVPVHYGVPGPFEIVTWNACGRATHPGISGAWRDGIVRSMTRVASRARFHLVGP